MGKKRIESVVTPRGTAVYPKLVEPDEYEGEKNYKTGLLLDPADPAHAKFIDEVNAAAQDAYDAWLEEAKEELKEAPGPKKAKLKKAIEDVEVHSPLNPEFDDEGDETGKFILNVKMKAEGTNKKTGKSWKRVCPIFDSRGKKINDTVDSIWGGSILKLEVTLNPFGMPATGRAGVSGRLEAVQIIELSSGGGGGGKFGVEEDGYVAEDDEQTSRFDEDVADDVEDDEDF